MVKLFLIPSTRMDEQRAKTNEDILLRMTKRGRDLVGKAEIEISAGGIERVLQVTRAYQSDIDNFEKNFPDMGKDNVGWVSNRTARALTGKGNCTFEAQILEEGIVEIKLGCDPEFVFCKNGKSHEARYILEDKRISNIYGGPLGCDVNGYQAELRPAPSTNVQTLISNIRHILETDGAKIKEYEWYAGSYKVRPIGGHIHVGNPRQVTKSDPLKFAFIHSTARVLDELVAIPLSRIEGEDGKTRRTTKNPKIYGVHLDYRTEAGRLEWRVPGGDWMVHPKVAESTLATSQAVIEEIVKIIVGMKGKIVERDEKLRASIDGWEKDWERHPIIKALGLSMTSEELDNVLKGGPTKVALKDILAKIQGLTTYHKHKQNIDFFSWFCSSNASTIKKLERDMRKTWLEGAEIFK